MCTQEQGKNASKHLQHAPYALYVALSNAPTVAGMRLSGNEVDSFAWAARRMLLRAGEGVEAPQTWPPRDALAWRAGATTAVQLAAEEPWRAAEIAMFGRTARHCWLVALARLRRAPRADAAPLPLLRVRSIVLFRLFQARGGGLLPSVLLQRYGMLPGVVLQRVNVVVWAVGHVNK